MYYDDASSIVNDGIRGGFIPFTKRSYKHKKHKKHKRHISK